MTNDILLVQVCDNANDITTCIMTCNADNAIKWCKYYVHECKYPEAWIIKVKFNEVNFSFAVLAKSPCVYMLSENGLRFNNL